jgi:2-polyprenyl-3-methyl-5-hydroxy-6-metoxy-1,4-benzoquinol methylase
MVLDVGQSTRERIALFDRSRTETTDINIGESTADDICAPSRLQAGRYDGIVCLSVLEHVYDPFAAISEIRRLWQAPVQSPWQ